MKERIEALANRRLQWLNAIEAGDVDAIVYFMKNDAYLILPDRTCIKSADSIRKWLRKSVEKLQYKWLLLDTTRLAGEFYAFEKGFFSLSVKWKINGSITEQNHNYIILWHLVEETKWRIEFVAVNAVHKKGLFYY
ncbi:MAG TPA: hypothetical protein VF692_04180 [Pyrinomonadaceae bacterium]